MILSQEDRTNWMKHYYSAKRRIAWTGLALLSAFGTIFIAATRIAAAAPPGTYRQQAQAEVLPEGSRPDELSFGKQQRTKPNEIKIPLEFSPSEQELPNRIRSEIEFGEGPWHFETAAAPRGASLKISVKQRSEERKNPPGGRGRITVLSLEISAGNGTIPSGLAGLLVFALERHESVEAIPLVLRKWELARVAEQALEPPSMIEPPSGVPGLNPSAGCFVFSH